MVETISDDDLCSITHEPLKGCPLLLLIWGYLHRRSKNILKSANLSNDMMRIS